jgi:hypothetical protein
MTAIATSQASRVGRALVRNFTGLWFTLLAALPVIATEFGVIPMYDSQRRLLPACAPFFCFLGFACIFSLRHVRLTITDHCRFDTRTAPNLDQLFANVLDPCFARCRSDIPVGLRERTGIADVSCVATKLR